MIERKKLIKMGSRKLQQRCIKRCIKRKLSTNNPI